MKQSTLSWLTILACPLAVWSASALVPAASGDAERVVTALVGWLALAPLAAAGVGAAVGALVKKERLAPVAWVALAWAARATMGA